MTRVLFLTAGNGVRGQMAQAIVEAVAGDDFEVTVSSTNPQAMGRLSQVVLAEMGARVSPIPPSTVEQVADQHWDVVVTIADEDEMPSPPVVGLRNERWPVGNPLAVPGFSGRLAALRSVRDSIRAHVQELLPSLRTVAA